MNCSLPITCLRLPAFLAFGLLVAGSPWAAGPAHALTLTVTSTVDPGDGNCTAAGTGDGCTLREAITVANTTAGEDTIVFAPGVSGTIQLASALPVISRHLQIIGPGAKVLTIRGQGSYFVIIEDTFDSELRAALSGITITNGGINHRGLHLTLTDCTISGTNYAGLFIQAYSNYGSDVTAVGCSFVNNNGRGIQNDAASRSANLFLRNCTFSGNEIGVRNNGYLGHVYLSHCTFSNNTSACLYLNSGETLGFMRMDHTIFKVAGTGVSLYKSNSGTFTSLGYNVCNDTGGSILTAPGDQILTDPGLDPAGLRDNGGQTPTVAILPSSSARNAGNPAITGQPAYDQRGPGFPRVEGGRIDVGAIEYRNITQPGPVFVVNSLDDHDDGNPTLYDCTLREAINAANTAAGPNTVLFQPGLYGPITLSPAFSTLTISGSATLVGPGARKLTLQRNTPGQILVFNTGPHHVSGLTISGGSISGGPSGNFARGGGISTTATLTLSGCTISNHTADGGDSSLTPGQPGGAAYGGGVANFGGGNLTLERCTLANNLAQGGHGGNNPGQLFSGAGGEANGGAVFNDSGCTLTVVNSTIHGNLTSGGDAGAAILGASGGDGQGAVCNFGTMTMTACTLSANHGQGGQSGPTNGVRRGTGGISAGGGSTSLLRNTLCASNSGSGLDYARQIYGTFTSHGFNLISEIDGATGFTAQGDQTGTFASPLAAPLGPFQNNGGPTDTLAPQPNSPALDRGKSFGLTTDQRGAARTYDAPASANAAGGDGTDIGAYESRPTYTGPPYFASVVHAQSAIQLQLQGSPFVYYQLQSSSNVSGGFTNTGSTVLTDGLGLVDFTDAGPLPPRRFYRALRIP